MIKGFRLHSIVLKEYNHSNEIIFFVNFFKNSKRPLSRYILNSIVNETKIYLSNITLKEDKKNFYIEKANISNNDNGNAYKPIKIVLKNNYKNEEINITEFSKIKDYVFFDIFINRGINLTKFGFDKYLYLSEENPSVTSKSFLNLKVYNHREPIILYNYDFFLENIKDFNEFKLNCEGECACNLIFSKDVERIRVIRSINRIKAEESWNLFYHQYLEYKKLDNTPNISTISFNVENGFPDYKNENDYNFEGSSKNLKWVSIYGFSIDINNNLVTPSKEFKNRPGVFLFKENKKDISFPFLTFHNTKEEALREHKRKKLYYDSLIESIDSLH